MKKIDNKINMIEAMLDMNNVEMPSDAFILKAWQTNFIEYVIDFKS